jgi:hypothetical protein
VHRHLSSLMCLQSPNFHSEGSSHFDKIAATRLVNFPRRSRVNEGEARRVSMLREASSFIFVRTSQNLSRFRLGLIFSVKILIFGNFQTGRHLLFHFRLKQNANRITFGYICRWILLHDNERDKWTLCRWFSTVLDRIRFLGTYIS